MVIGSSEAGPISRVFLGSGAAKIVRHSPVPVLAVLDRREGTRGRRSIAPPSARQPLVEIGVEAPDRAFVPAEFHELVGAGAQTALDSF